MKTAALRLDESQRFTCSQCGRCCRRPWEIAITAAELELYRKAKVARLYRDSPEAREGTARDPFEPIPGTFKFHRIRKRSDGACGFLSPQNRCRIHEELGASKKPLTCRMFPLRFHAAPDAVVVATSFCCPTTIASEGASMRERIREISALRAEWFSVYPEKPGRLEFVKGCPLDAKTLATLREVLKTMLDRPGPNGRLDLRSNVRRMAGWLEDLSRYRVVRLGDEAFSEYVSLTGLHAAKSEKPAPPRAPSAVGRLMQRGFLFLVAATRVQVENSSFTGWRLGLRLRLVRLLAHFHGLGPGVAGIDLRAARRVRLDLLDPELHKVAYHYLRSSLETLGTGKKPILDELAAAFSYLNAAESLAAMRAALGGRASDAQAFSEALMEAVDLTHADARGWLGRILTTFSSGIEALRQFADARNEAP